MATTVLESKLTNHLNSMSSNFKASMDEYLQYEKGSLLRDRYRFLTNLQNGSFGKVTCALDTTTNEKVAIKSMKRSVPGVSFMARHEISVMKRLGYHPNICQLLESFETRKYVIMVLEYIPGGDMYDAIHNHTDLGMAYQDDTELFARMCTQLVDVIQYAHSKGIYHRDVKPENVLLMSDGDIKLCDWGLATSAINCKDFNVGTEKYMAPEALGKHSSSETYNSRLADSWSVGITLLFTLFGKCPFRKALPSDVNYSNFLKSKAFLYDYYPNLSSTGFLAIVDRFMVDRDLVAGIETINSDGVRKGFTLDQEYKFELLQGFHTPIEDSDEEAEDKTEKYESTGDGHLGGEFYMFDQEAVNELDEAKFTEDSSVEEDKENNVGVRCSPPIDISSSSGHTNKMSVSSSMKSYMVGSSSLFDRASPSIMNSVDTIPEEEYINSSSKNEDKLDIDNYILNFQNILKTHDDSEDDELSQNVLSSDTLC
ncbi:DEKNAAC100582 [Brettanomyces naardenensis]|uniref:non-specific serine/threonine protein kinase n=1 Tax=Brettanomyces naardenensis TaxID=13370 RepID=A0A448YF36_BRENA|nr:DEKNAAC100582 [Brettanomyces naardenensis]